MKDKLCIECANFINAKPMARCDASRYTDLVTGDKKRTCFIERLDGYGRCSSMANNFSPKKETEPKEQPKTKVKK